MTLPVCTLVLFAFVVTSSATPIKLAVTTPAPISFGGEGVMIINNNYFVTNITLGLPNPQVFSVIVDTSSATTWIPDLTCTDTVGLCPDGTYLPKGTVCYGKNRFNSSKSSTYTADGRPFSLTNKFGMTSGRIGADTMRLATDVRDAIIIPNTLFGQTSWVPDAITCLPGVDGVLGLGFQSIAADNILPPFQNAVRQGLLDDSVFSIWLEDQWQSADNGSEGVIAYGGYDPVHCTPQRTMYPLTSNEYYQFTLQSFSSANYQYNIKTQTILDSSSNVISLPATVFSAIKQQLGVTSSSYPVKVDCAAQIDLVFNIGNTNQYHVTTKNLIYNMPDGTCYAAIAQSVTRPDGLIRFELGTPFLRGRCTYFDPWRNRMGVADAKMH